MAFSVMDADKRTTFNPLDPAGNFLGAAVELEKGQRKKAANRTGVLVVAAIVVLLVMGKR